MVKRILVTLLCLSSVSPAYAGDRDYQYSGYSSYGRSNGHHEDRSSHREYHRRGRGSATSTALVAGLILGAAIAKSAHRSETRAAYSEREWTPDCYDRKVTEQTLSGRLVTYTETVCR